MPHLKYWKRLDSRWRTLMFLNTMKHLLWVFFEFIFELARCLGTLSINALGFFLLIFKGQILANLKAMDSDWFAQNYMGRSSKVRKSSHCCYTVMMGSSTIVVWLGRNKNDTNPIRMRGWVKCARMKMNEGPSQFSRVRTGTRAAKLRETHGRRDESAVSRS